MRSLNWSKISNRINHQAGAEEVVRTAGIMAVEEIGEGAEAEAVVVAEDGEEAERKRRNARSKAKINACACPCPTRLEECESPKKTSLSKGRRNEWGPCHCIPVFTVVRLQPVPLSVNTFADTPAQQMVLDLPVRP